MSDLEVVCNAIALGEQAKARAEQAVQEAQGALQTICEGLDLLYDLKLSLEQQQQGGPPAGGGSGAGLPETAFGSGKVD